MSTLKIEHITNIARSGEDLSIDTSGNVGIGISAPGAKLQVAGTQNTPSGTSKGMLLVRADGSTHGLQMGVTGSAPWGSWIQAQDNNISSPYPLTLQPGGGNVGIGTTSPGFPLSVEKDNSTWVSRIYNTGSDADASGLLVRTDATSAHNAITLGVYADSGYQMVVRSTGNVGIGTISPDRALHIEGSDFASSTIRLKRTGGGTNNDAGLQFQSAAGANADTGMGGIWFQNSLDGNAYALIRARTDDATGTSGRLDFMTSTSLVDNNTSPNMTIKSDGNVGIGTTSPTDDITKFGGSALGLSVAAGQPAIAVRATGNAQYVGYLGQAGSNTYLGAVGGGDLYFQTGTSGTTNMTIKSDGNVGINVTDPTDKLTLTVGNGGGILQSTYYSGTVTSGQKMGVIGFKGYSQGNTVAGADAKIEGVADGAHSGTSAPARLDFYTKDSSIGPGSGATRRFRIDEQGAAFVHASKNNWSRFVQADNTSVHYRLYGASSSTTNYNLLRFRRHYWGSGSVHITLFQTYYSTTSQGEYWLAGHGRSDGSYTPNYNLVYRDIYNGPGSGRLSINQPGGAPGNSDAEIVDVSISIPAYVYYIVKVEVSHSTFYPTTSTMPGVNSYALFS